MLIEKKYQGTLPDNKIVNTMSDSQTDCYSCDYINNLNTYSEEEIVIGTHNDKPLYRKCFKHQFNGTYDDTPTNQMISFIKNAIGTTVESVIHLSATASNPNLDRIANLGYSFQSNYGSVEYRTYAGLSGGDMVQIGLLKNITGIDGNTLTLNDTTIDVIFEYTKVVD